MSFMPSVPDMPTTAQYGLLLPRQTDIYEVDDFNYNFEKIAVKFGLLDAEDLRLDTRITTEVNRLDGRINAEAATRASEDSSLSSRINSEASTRASEDSSLSSRINSEASTRASEDSSLSTRISNIEAFLESLEDGGFTGGGGGGDGGDVDLSGYLPLTGGTMTGDINMNDNTINFNSNRIYSDSYAMRITSENDVDISAAALIHLRGALRLYNLTGTQSKINFQPYGDDAYITNDTNANTTQKNIMTIHSKDSVIVECVRLVFGGPSYYWALSVNSSGIVTFSYLGTDPTSNGAARAWLNPGSGSGWVSN